MKQIKSRYKQIMLKLCTFPTPELNRKAKSEFMTLIHMIACDAWADGNKEGWMHDIGEYGDWWQDFREQLEE